MPCQFVVPKGTQNSEAPSTSPHTAHTFYSPAFTAKSQTKNHDIHPCFACTTVECAHRRTTMRALSLTMFCDRDIVGRGVGVCALPKMQTLRATLQSPPRKDWRRIAHGSASRTTPEPSSSSTSGEKILRADHIVHECRSKCLVLHQTRWRRHVDGRGSKRGHGWHPCLSDGRTNGIGGRGVSPRSWCWGPSTKQGAKTRPPLLS